MGLVVKAREVAMEVEGDIRAREAARRQVRQIMVGEWGCNACLDGSDAGSPQKFKMDRKIVSPRVT